MIPGPARTSVSKVNSAALQKLGSSLSGKMLKIDCPLTHRWTYADVC